MLETTRYIRKPFHIDAVQVTAENMNEIAKWCQGDIRTEPGENGEDTNFVKVRVHRPLNDKQTKAYVGDWVLYAGTGYKVYKDKAFKSNFQQVANKESVLVDTDQRLPDSPKKPKKSMKTRTAVQRTPVHGDVTVVVQEPESIGASGN